MSLSAVFSRCALPALLCLALLLAACAQAGPIQPSPSPAAPVGSPVPTQAGTATQPVQPSASVAQPLVIWLPPQFDPSGSGPAAVKLRARLDAYQSANPEVKIQVRIKALNGPGGLLDALSSTNAAAPANLPALVALSRSDLESAALKGLVYPLDGLTRLVDEPDWYAYARQLALIQGSLYGLPFAGDVVLLAYRPLRISTAPTDWPSILNYNLPLSFPAGEPQASLTLLLYLSAGGQVKDSQGHPTLQAGVLAKVLRLYADGVKQGVLPSWLVQTQTATQAWQAFSDQRAQWLVSWSSRLLAEATPPEIAIAGLPSLGPAGSQPLTLADGWVWALSEPNSDRRPAAVRLAESLVSSEFMSQWTASAGYLPTRPTALAAWPNQSLKAALSPIVLAAQTGPAVDLMASLGPVLQEATLQVLKEQADPAQVAQAAADKLVTPPNR